MHSAIMKNFVFCDTFSSFGVVIAFFKMALYATFITRCRKASFVQTPSYSYYLIMQQPFHLGRNCWSMTNFLFITTAISNIRKSFCKFVISACQKRILFSCKWHNSAICLISLRPYLAPGSGCTLRPAVGFLTAVF